MSRFDKIIDEKNAEALEAENRKSVKDNIGLRVRQSFSKAGRRLELLSK